MRRVSRMKAITKPDVVAYIVRKYKLPPSVASASWKASNKRLEMLAGTYRHKVFRNGEDPNADTPEAVTPMGARKADRRERN